MNPQPLPRPKAALALALLSAGIACSAFGITRNVSTYGAYPDDGVDDTASINNAIVACASGDVLAFDAGTYDLITPYDAARFIKISNKTGITLQGASSGGAPATKLLRHVTVQNDASPPRTAYIYGSTNITMTGFIVDNTPHLCTSGKITAIDPAGKYIRVQVLDGLPMQDGSACYAANAWEPASAVLKKVPSLTFSTSPANWTIYDSANRIMQLYKAEGLSFLGHVAVNDRMSWHSDCLGVSQIEVATSANVALTHLLVRNAINMAFLIGSTNGVTLSHIDLVPEGNQLPVGPRDAFHFSRCTGVVACDNLNVKGVRMDGLVLRTPYAAVSAITDSTHFNIAFDLATFGQTIAAGSVLNLYNPNGDTSPVTVASATWQNDTGGKGNYTIVSSTPLPVDAVVGTPLTSASLSPSAASVIDSTFENVAGSAIIALVGNLTIDGITATNVMYPVVHIGDNVGEGGCGSNITVRNSVFDSCAWRPKLDSDLPGMITVANIHLTYTTPKIRNLTIENNTFRNHLFDSAYPAVNVFDAKTVALTDNLFENTSRGIKIDAATVSGVTSSSSDIVIDNTNNALTYSEPVGTFSDSALTGYNGTKSRYSASTGAKAQWSFTAPATGSYAVYIYKVVYPTSDANAKITTTSNSGSSVTYLNYTTGTSGWVSLGTFNFTEGGTYTVTNERSAGFLRSDAVLFQQL